LARLLAADMIPAVWVPPLHVRELRCLLAHRQHLVAQRAAAKNRLQSLLLRHNFVPPAGELRAAEQRSWWDKLELPSSERRARQDLLSIAQLSALIAEVAAEVAQLSVQASWSQRVPFLLQLAAVGLLTAMTVLAAIGEIERFPSAKQLVGYSGLGARVHASGQTNHGGGITKQGRRDLRTALVEAAWVAVRVSPHWRERYERLALRIGTAKAITAIARKLLVTIWHLLSAPVADQAAEPEAVARRLLRWGIEHRVARRQGLSRAEFVRQKLQQIGLAEELAEFSCNGQVFRLRDAASDSGTSAADIAASAMSRTETTS
jgi:transposase